MTFPTIFIRFQSIRVPDFLVNCCVACQFQLRNHFGLRSVALFSLFVSASAWPLNAQCCSAAATAPINVSVGAAATPSTDASALIDTMISSLELLHSGDVSVDVVDTSPSPAVSQEAIVTRSAAPVTEKAHILFDRRNHRLRYETVPHSETTSEMKCYVRSGPEAFSYSSSPTKQSSLVYHDESSLRDQEYGQIDLITLPLLTRTELRSRLVPQERESRLFRYLRELSRGAVTETTDDGFVRIVMVSTGKVVQRRILWLDPQHGFLPVRTEWHYQTRVKTSSPAPPQWSPLETTLVEWDFDGHEVPAPVTVVVDGDPKISRRIFYLTWSSVNATPAAGFFTRADVNPSPGTIVLDKRLPVPAVVEMVGVLPPAEMAIAQKSAAKLLAEGGLTSVPDSDRYSRLIVIISINVAAITLLLMFVGYRKLFNR